MNIVFLPVYRVTIGYYVSFGRRWTVLEHLLLVAVKDAGYGISDLANMAKLPKRLVIEAMVNLVRANWVEVKSLDAGVIFKATSVGERFSTQLELPVSLERRLKSIVLCSDRIAGSWMAADELEFVFERDLPQDAVLIEPLRHTYDSNESSIRGLLRLDTDETLEAAPPHVRSISCPYCRIVVGSRTVQAGLPQERSIYLEQFLVKDFGGEAAADEEALIVQDFPLLQTYSDFIQASDIIVGTSNHLDLLRDCLRRAATAIVIHSCFVSSDTIKMILPDLEQAARRKVRVELLWGLQEDEDDLHLRQPILASERVLDGLPPQLRARVQFSPATSGSHAKIIIYDDVKDGRWFAVVGSCNFLSSKFDWFEASIRLSNRAMVRKLLGKLISGQLPASGAWTPLAKRLDRIWASMNVTSDIHPRGNCELVLLADQEHYGSVTMARDLTQGDIVIGCDLFGMAAETSVLVPMATAASGGHKVKLHYARASKKLLAEGSPPKSDDLAQRGLYLSRVEKLHAKYMHWFPDVFVITSFNWMATVSSAARIRDAEIGVLVKSKSLREEFAKQTAAYVDQNASPS